MTTERAAKLIEMPNAITHPLTAMKLRKQSVALLAAELEAAGIATDGYAHIIDGGEETLAALMALDRAILADGRRVALEAVGAEARQDENGDWSAEIQTVGGHGLLATVYGETRVFTEALQTTILRALAKEPRP